MTSMIERCTKAMMASEPWSSFWSEDDARKLVRSVIVAMEDPTLFMIFAGDEAGGGAGKCEPTPVTEGVWAAMIDAALKEQP